MSFHGATVKLKIERILAEGMIAKEYLGVLSGGAVDQDFYTKNFPIVDLAAKLGESNKADGGGTDTIFPTELDEADNYWDGFTIRFLAGSANVGEMRVISAYAQATGQITVATAFGAAVLVDDAFELEPSVNVYWRAVGGAPGSETEYVEGTALGGSDYYIEGDTGLVKILAAENQAGDAGKFIMIEYYTSAEVGLGQSASIDFGGSLEDVYTLGSRNPQEIKEGSISIGGTIDQLYCSRDLIGKFLGERDFYGLLTDFSFYLYPNGETVGQPEIKLSNVKFGGGSISVDVGGIMAANVTFKGLVIAVGTV